MGKIYLHLLLFFTTHAKGTELYIVLLNNYTCYSKFVYLVIL